MRSFHQILLLVLLGSLIFLLGCTEDQKIEETGTEGCDLNSLFSATCIGATPPSIEDNDVESDGGSEGGSGCSSPTIIASNSLFTSGLAQPGTIDTDQEKPAQSFSFSSAKYITRIDLKMGKNSIGNNELSQVTLDIRADQENRPSIVPLTLSTISGSQVPSGAYGWTQFDLPAHYPVNAATTYWMVVEGFFLGAGQGFLIQATSSGGSNWYPGGSHKWTVNDEVGWATPGGNPDMAFRIYGCDQ